MIVEANQKPGSIWPPEFLKTLVKRKTDPESGPSQQLSDGLKRFGDPLNFEMKAIYKSLQEKYGLGEAEKYLADVCDRYEETCGLDLIRTADYKNWMRAIHDQSVELAKLIHDGAPSGDLILPQWRIHLNGVLQIALSNMGNDLFQEELEPIALGRQDVVKDRPVLTQPSPETDMTEFASSRHAKKVSVISSSGNLSPSAEGSSKPNRSLLRQELAKLSVTDFLIALAQLAAEESSQDPVFYTKELHGVSVPKKMGKGNKLGFENVLAKMIKTLTRESFGEANYALVATVLNVLLGADKGNPLFDEMRVEGITA